MYIYIHMYIYICIYTPYIDTYRHTHLDEHVCTSKETCSLTDAYVCMPRVTLTLAVQVEAYIHMHRHAHI